MSDSASISEGAAPSRAWPPIDRLAAAGLGDLYGATIRRLEEHLRRTGGDARALGQLMVEIAETREIITVRDSSRLLEYVAGREGDGESRTAAELFQEAMDDPSSSPLAIGALSVARYEEQTATGTDAPTTIEGVLAVAGIAMGGMYVAIELDSSTRPFPE
jgi:hypothetical protein